MSSLAGQSLIEWLIKGYEAPLDISTDPSPQSQTNTPARNQARDEIQTGAVHFCKKLLEAGLLQKVGEGDSSAFEVSS